MFKGKNTKNLTVARKRKPKCYKKFLKNFLHHHRDKFQFDLYRKKDCTGGYVNLIRLSQPKIIQSSWTKLASWDTRPNLQIPAKYHLHGNWHQNFEFLDSEQINSRT